jgi:hypothetical protein
MISSDGQGSNTRRSFYLLGSPPQLFFIAGGQDNVDTLLRQSHRHRPAQTLACPPDNGRFSL